MRIIIYVMSFFIISAEKFSNETKIFTSETYVQHEKYPDLRGSCHTAEAKMGFLGYIKDMYYNINVSRILGIFGENKLDKLKKHKYYENDLIQLKIYEKYSGENENKLLPTLLPVLDAIPDKIIIKKGIIYTGLNSIVSGINITETIPTAPTTNSNNATYTDIPTRLDCYSRATEKSEYADHERVMPPEKKEYADLEYVMPPELNGYADLEYVMPPELNEYVDLEYVMPPEINEYVDLEYVMPPEINEYVDLEYVIMDGAEMYAHYRCGGSLEKQKFQLSDEESEKKIIKKIDMPCTLRLNTRTIMNNFVVNLTPVLSTIEENSLIDWFTSDVPFELRFSYICKFVSPLQTFVNKNILQYKILNFTVSGYQLKKFKFSTQCIGLTYCLQHQHINNYVSNLDEYFLYKFEV
ncbi:uncharacterized protein LOC142333452 isoform X7 [Lycorma delicatula]|uniref:uncharacterized protein LOC142333452 isoform X7 n=1 Tax=Lycorma delicatula TaxID=130591 RepID=UPI003F517163